MAKTKTANEIDPEVLDEPLKGVKDEEDLHGVLKQLSKQLIKRALEVKMTKHLGRDKGGVVVNLEGNSVTAVVRRGSRGS